MIFLLKVLFGLYIFFMFFAGRFLRRFIWLVPLALTGGILKIILDVQEERLSRNWVGEGPGYFDDFTWPFMALTHAVFLLLIGSIGFYFQRRALKGK